MNYNLPNYHFFVALLLMINILAERVQSFTNEISKNATDHSVSWKESVKIDTKSSLKVNNVNVTAENPLENHNETAVTDIPRPSDRGFLNWVYPNPSILKQAYWRFVFDGIIAMGTYFQYDTVKRQILITLGRILRQYKLEKAERDERRKDAAIYYNSYNYPYGYQDTAGYQNQVGHKEEKPEYQPTDGDIKEEKPEYQPTDGYIKEEKPEYQLSDGDIKEQKPEYQQSTDSGQSSYASYDNQLIEKRLQYLGEEKTVKSKIQSPRVKERLISLTNKVCFQKGLCQLEKLSSFSPSMASLWSEIRSLFSSSDANDHLPDQLRHLNCDKMFSSCYVSSLELIKFLLQ